MQSSLASGEEMVEPSLAELELAGSRRRPGESVGLTTRRWLLLIAVLGGLTAFGPLSIDMYLPAFPSISDELGASASGVQLSLTSCLAGLAIGQLLAGPLSDQIGRRVPLLVGVGAFVVTSVACGFSPSLPALIGLRFLQGVTGAAGIVVARAVVRDLYQGSAAARFFSHLMIITGLAPIFAPLMGAQVMEFAGWREIFFVLGGIGLVLLLGVALGVPETWPAERRTVMGWTRVLRNIAGLTRDRELVGYALASGMAFAALFAYISGSSFVLQNVYGVSPQVFSVVFALNAFGLVLAGQVNGRLVDRFSPLRLLWVGLTVMAVAGAGLVVVAATPTDSLIAFLVPLFLVVTGMGLVIPNATALALNLHPEAAGSASALMGVLQFIVGAAVAPVVGLAGQNTALPMAVVIALAGVAAWMVLFVVARPGSAST